MRTDQMGKTAQSVDAAVPNHYASGNWQVTPGQESEFIERWTDLLKWTRQTHPGLVSATLIRNSTNKTHFVSFAEWPDAESRAAWKQDPGWEKRHSVLRSLCEDFHGGDFNRLVTI